MSNQDLINYMLSLEETNNNQIIALESTISSINSTIDNLNLQIINCNEQIDLLNADNNNITSIIAFIPPD